MENVNFAGTDKDWDDGRSVRFEGDEVKGQKDDNSANNSAGSGDDGCGKNSEGTCYRCGKIFRYTQDGDRELMQLSPQIYSVIATLCEKTISKHFAKIMPGYPFCGPEFSITDGGCGECGTKGCGSSCNSSCCNNNSPMNNSAQATNGESTITNHGSCTSKNCNNCNQGSGSNFTQYPYYGNASYTPNWYGYNYQSPWYVYGQRYNMPPPMPQVPYNNGYWNYASQPYTPYLPYYNTSGPNFTTPMPNTPPSGVSQSYSANGNASTNKEYGDESEANQSTVQTSACSNVNQNSMCGTGRCAPCGGPTSALPSGPPCRPVPIAPPLLTMTGCASNCCGGVCGQPRYMPKYPATCYDCNGGSDGRYSLPMVDFYKRQQEFKESGPGGPVITQKALAALGGDFIKQLYDNRYRYTERDRQRVFGAIQDKISNILYKELF